MLDSADVLIAVDGGMRYLTALGLKPDVLIGDLDSVDPTVRQALETAGIEVLRYPEHKDETDFELALELAVQRGYDPIVVVGALGGRLDQTLGNLFLLTRPQLHGRRIRFDDGQEEAFVITESARIEGAPGDRVSLLPLLGDADGVETDGLAYPLRGETLRAEKTRGISNVMLDKTAGVRLDGGLLLCLHTRFNLNQ